jgi:hypothetical protein
METIYDWVTVLLFAGIVTLFLHRSVDAERSGDSIWKYLLASVGCAGANWLGNHGWDLAAIATLAATIAFIIYGLRLIPPR